MGVVPTSCFEIERTVSKNQTLFAAGTFTFDDCLKFGYRHSLFAAAKKQNQSGNPVSKSFSGKGNSLVLHLREIAFNAQSVFFSLQVLLPAGGGFCSLVQSVCDLSGSDGAFFL
jgi:hypothetical protein